MSVRACLKKGWLSFLITGIVLVLTNIAVVQFLPTIPGICRHWS